MIRLWHSVLGTSRDLDIKRTVIRFFYRTLYPCQPKIPNERLSVGNLAWLWHSGNFFPIHIFVSASAKFVLLGITNLTRLADWLLWFAPLFCLCPLWCRTNLTGHGRNRLNHHHHLVADDPARIFENLTKRNSVHDLDFNHFRFYGQLLANA